jgi:hypothetical protein
MAHPNRKEGQDSHNAKLKRMTEDYGLASGAANNKLAPSESMKGGEGPEDAIGFGANPDKPRGRADRAGRKQLVANPVATLKTGGSVSKRARGGRKGHGRTQVNVVVAPQGAGVHGGAPPVVPVPPVAGGMPPAVMAPRPPGPPMGAGPMGPPPMAGPGGPPIPMAPGAPGGVPPGLLPPRRYGGAIHRKDGGSIGGSGAGDTMMKHSRKEQGLAPPSQGEAGSKYPKIKHHMTAGSVSGEGRLEKIGRKPKVDHRTQVV